jgi:hypothetical protein
MEVDMGRFSFALAFILATAPAFAHDSKGPNGGRITDLGPFHAELTTKGTTVELYVTDTANKGVAMDGYKGLAVIVAGTSWPEQQRWPFHQMRKVSCD